MTQLGGFMGKVLRVDLSSENFTDETIDESTLRKYLGGTGLGAKIMYDEVPANVEWSDPENRLIWLTGPFNGTKVPGSGLYTVATKGPLSNMFVASHCNGFFGARLKFAGYDTIIFQGAAKNWVYLYIHDGTAEIRDASHLVGMDSWDTEAKLKEEIGEKKVSVSCIGTAGENLVKYACICSDRGHVAASNGCGAVMGSKKIKAIVVHGNAKVPIHDKESFNADVKAWWQELETTLWGMMIPPMGTSCQYSASHDIGFLAVRNYTASIFPEHTKFNGDSQRAYYQGKRRPCYACKWGHCHEIELKSGPHKGEIVEESEYEGAVAFSSNIGNTDLDATHWLNNVNDRLGMDAKEQASVIGLAIECYEKGLITKEDTDGIELTWGNVDAVETLLHKIAKREGFGEVLAEGVMRAAQKIGGDAPNFAVHNKKGHAPHVIDSRGMWFIMFSMATTDMGAGAAGDMGDVGDLLPTVGAEFMSPDAAHSPDHAPKMLPITMRRAQFIDSLGICMFVSGVQLKHVAKTLSSVTGWDFTWEEAAEVGYRIHCLLRLFNMRCGLTRENDGVSPRIAEAPIEGPAKGISVADKWDQMLDTYYDGLGWDREGRPLPETLNKLGLEMVP